MPGRSAANRPSFVLAVCAAVILGTYGAWHFLEGPTSSAPRRAAAAPRPEPVIPGEAPAASEEVAETREQHLQYALAIERALAAGDPRQRETAFAMLLPELLAADPAAAVEILERQPAGEARDGLRDQMAGRWILLDRESATSWMESLPEEAERRAAATQAMHALAARSPAQAIATADHFGVGRDDGSLEYIVQVWAETDLAAARRWMASQPPSARNASLRGRIEQVAAHNERGGD